jgi:hypothetical protein
MTAEQEREDRRKVVEEAVSTLRLPTSGRWNSGAALLISVLN